MTLCHIRDMCMLKKNPKKLLSPKAIYLFVFATRILEEFILPYISLSHSLSLVWFVSCYFQLHLLSSFISCTFSVWDTFLFFLISCISFFSTSFLPFSWGTFFFVFFAMAPLSTSLRGNRWKNNSVYILLVPNNLSDKMRYHSVTFSVMGSKLTMHINMSLEVIIL